MPTNSPVTAGVFGNLAELAGDITNLAELQVKLTTLDLKTSLGRAAVPASILAIGLVLLLAATPIALIGTAELVADALALSHRGWAYLIVSGVAVAVSVVFALIAVPRLTKSFDNMVNTKEELDRNLAWIKTVLAHSGRPPSHRG